MRYGGIFIGLLLLGLSAALAAGDSGEPVKDLRRNIEAKKIKSVAELVAILPEAMRANWVPLFGSLSLQSGTRVLLAMPDGSLTVTFNIDPGLGYGAVEIKGRSKKKNGAFDFAEVDFESDEMKILSDGRPAISPHYVDGREFNEDVLAKTLHGEVVDCASCHPMGRTRFDLREAMARIRTDGKHRLSAEALLRRLGEGTDPRLKALKIPSALSPIIASGDTAKFGDYLETRVIETHTAFAKTNAEVVADKVLADLAKKPGLALPMLGALKGCSLSDLVSPTEWNENINAMKSLDPEAQTKLRWHGDRPDEAGLIDELARIVGKRQADHALTAEGRPDPKTDRKLVAKLVFLWDPFSEKIHGDRPDAHLNTKVSQWGMTPHFVGYFFGGTFDFYVQALAGRLRNFVKDQFKLAPADQTCAPLATRATEWRREQRTALLPHDTMLNGHSL